jgi:hypothetical protein
MSDFVFILFISPSAPKSPKGDFIFFNLVIGYWLLFNFKLRYSLFVIPYSSPDTRYSSPLHSSLPAFSTIALAYPYQHSQSTDQFPARTRAD